MATVRFSGNLTYEIMETAKRVFTKRIEQATANLPSTWQGDVVYDLMFKETVAKMAALPNHFMNTAEQVKIQGFQPGNEEDHLPGRTITIKFTGKKLWPFTHNLKSMGLVKNQRPHFGLILDGDDPRWNNIKPSYMSYCQQVWDIEGERQVFVAGVEKVIKTYSTLAPALKAWPPLWDLIPEEAKIRHKTIVDRTKTEAVIEGVDLDSLTSTVALDRITR